MPAFFDAPESQAADGASGQGESEQRGVTPVVVEPGGSEKEPPSGPQALWYYEEERAARYAAFASANPGTAEEDVVWMVDADLDIPPYEQTNEVPDPDSLTVMVNKHFSLPADYTPSDLVTIGKTQMRAEAAAAMQEMIDAAAAEGHRIWSQSGFRSYGVQVSLFDRYAERDGVEGAETYSARAGFSEHQTGLTTDLNTITDAFGATPEGIWVAENCWRFGYIVRYTSENTDVTLYRPEPWHMRYIGREAASEMRDMKILSFEEYWVKYVKHTPPPVG